MFFETLKHFKLPAKFLVKTASQQIFYYEETLKSFAQNNYTLFMKTVFLFKV